MRSSGMYTRTAMLEDGRHYLLLSNIWWHKVGTRQRKCSSSLG